MRKQMLVNVRVVTRRGELSPVVPGVVLQRNELWMGKGPRQSLVEFNGCVREYFDNQDVRDAIDTGGYVTAVQFWDGK